MEKTKTLNGNEYYKELLKELNEVVELHNKMKNSWFFTPYQKAYERRAYELNNSKILEFEWDGNTYIIKNETEMSCNHVYYKLKIYENGDQKKYDIRFVKKIIKKCEEVIKQ